jgi:hypothetical protein
LRRQLSKEQREQVMVDMRRDGMTLQEVADAVGVSYGTAHAVTENSLSELINSTVTGADGKTYPSKKKRKPAPPQQNIFDPGVRIRVASFDSAIFVDELLILMSREGLLYSQTNLLVA